MLSSWMIAYGSQVFQMNLVMASIAALAVLSVVLFVAVPCCRFFGHQVKLG
jgi:cyclic lactone autoinducer peptide